MDKKYILIGIIGSAVLLIVGALFYYSVYSPPYKKIHFSTAFHKAEVVMIRKIFKADIEEVERIDGNKVEIEIAKYDLNDDRIEDVFVTMKSRGLCGSQGCWTAIYIISRDGQWQEVYNFNTYALWGVVEKKHQGYHDLVQIGPTKDHPTSDNFLLQYKWKNGRYQGVGYRSLTKKDLEVFKDEIIQ